MGGVRVRVCVQRWPHGCAWEKAGDREGAHLAGGQRGGHVEVSIVVELRGVSPAHLADHLRHLRAFEGVVSGRMKESRLRRFVEYLTAQFFGQSEGLIP